MTRPLRMGAAVIAITALFGAGATQPALAATTRTHEIAPTNSASESQTQPASDSLAHPAASTQPGQTPQPEVTTYALPVWIARCIVGQSLNANDISCLISAATAGDWASVATIVGQNAAACIRGR